MAINKKLIHFKTRENFDKELNAGNILETSICFIKDSQLLYTHEQFYNCKGLSEEEINELIESYLYEDHTNGYEFVDMGEAGIWAKYPIGVNAWDENTLDKIKYFAWGETEGYIKSQVGTDKQFSEDLSDYKYSNDGWGQLTKYCNDPKYGKDGYTDNLITLLPEDDACTVNMGGNWRMPTPTEFQKLYDSCITEWAADYNGVSGLNGMLFKLKTNESKQLFFPASGYCLDGSTFGVGLGGYFWSSSLRISNPSEASELSLRQNSISPNGADGRHYGLPIVGFLNSTSSKTEKYAKKSEITRVTKNDKLVTEMYIEDEGDDTSIDVYTKSQIDNKLKHLSLDDLNVGTNVRYINHKHIIPLLAMDLALYDRGPKPKRRLIFKFKIREEFSLDLNKYHLKTEHTCQSFADLYNEADEKPFLFKFGFLDYQDFSISTIEDGIVTLVPLGYSSVITIKIQTSAYRYVTIKKEEDDTYFCLSNHLPVVYVERPIRKPLLNDIHSSVGYEDVGATYYLLNKLLRTFDLEVWLHKSTMLNVFDSIYPLHLESLSEYSRLKVCKLIKKWVGIFRRNDEVSHKKGKMRPVSINYPVICRIRRRKSGGVHSDWVYFRVRPSLNKEDRIRIIEVNLPTRKKCYKKIIKED